MISFSCPSCRQVMQARDEQAGTIVACPKCQTKLQPPRPVTTPEPKWFYVQDKQKQGPVAFAALRVLALSGKLRAEDMVLQEGTAKWLAANSVPNLFPMPMAQSMATPNVAAPTTPEDSAKPSTFARLKEVAGWVQEAVSKLKESHATILAVVAALPAVGGMIGDFLQPLAPFNGIICLCSLLAGVGLLTLFVKQPRWFSYPLGLVCAFLFLTAVSFGAWCGLSLFFGSSNQGFLATTIGPVANLQSNVVTRPETTVTRSETEVITQKKVEGDKLADEVRKTIETEKDATKLLQFALQGVPANVLKAEVVGEPKPKKGKGNELNLEYDLRIGVDVEQYDDYITKKLLPILDKVARRKGECFGSAKAANGSFEASVLIRSLDNATVQRLQTNRKPLVFGKMLKFEDDGTKTDFGAAWWQGDLDPKTEVVIIVNTRRNGADDKTTWKWFHVPRTDVFDWDRRRAAVYVRLTFQDKKGNEVNHHQVLIEGEGIPGVHLSYNANKYYPTPEVIISPYLIGHSYYTRTLTAKQATTFVPDELQKMTTIHGTVESVKMK